MLRCEGERPPAFVQSHSIFRYRPDHVDMVVKWWAVRQKAAQMPRMVSMASHPIYEHELETAHEGRMRSDGIGVSTPLRFMILV